ncbi:sensor histidine kinase, partial [Lachnoanaerobaculum sp.]
MLNYVSIYLVTLPIAFSILREYKAGLLWKNSYTKIIKESFSVYMLKRTFKKKLGSNFLVMILVDFVVVILFLLTTINVKSLFGRLTIFICFIIFLIINIVIFNKVYKTAIAFDKIAEAIKEIANGDTRYRLDESEFTGREISVVKDLNNISKGFQGAINEQVKSERLKADLITNVSHDIKTPLTSIINYVDLIKREKPENAKIQEYLDVLSVKSQHLKNLTEDLVEASKVSSGNISVELRDIDLVEMINQTNGEFEEKFAEKGLKIISTLPTTGIMIKADGRHLWRVLENLYNNAFKYAAKNSRIYIDITSENNIATFVIKNISENPLNIKPDELTERFVRGDVSRTTEGSGLGLSIAKSLTILQGGKFEIIIDGDLFKVQIRFKAV